MRSTPQMKNFALKANITNTILAATLDMTMLPSDVGVAPGHFMLSGSLWVMFWP